MYFNTEQGCCGLAEFYGVQEYKFLEDWKADPDRVMTRIFKLWQETNSYGEDEEPRDGTPVVVFTDAQTTKKSFPDGDKFAAYIKKNKLGHVTKGKPVLNPNSGNYVLGYLWSVNAKNFNAWYKKSLTNGK